MTGGFRLTAQAYAECWRERIHSEQVALANTLQQEQQRKLAAAEAETAALRKAVEAGQTCRFWEESPKATCIFPT